MAIKSVKSDGPPPKRVLIAYNGDTRFIDAVMKEIHNGWNVNQGYWEFNALMPKNSAIVYDRYDCIVVNTVKNKLYYRKVSKEEQNAAFVKASAGRISNPFQS